MHMHIIHRTLVVGCLGLLAGGVHSTLGKAIVTKDESKADQERQTLENQVAALKAALQSAQQAGVQAGSQAASQAGSQAASNSQPSPAMDNPALKIAMLGSEISIADAKMLQDAGALFVDARVREEYVAGHVSGAFLLPADMFSGPRPPEALQYMDKSATLVVYCGGGSCDASHNTARYLQQTGFTKIHIMTDGYPAWQQAGHAVDSGAPYYEAASTSGGGK